MVHGQKADGPFYLFARVLSLTLLSKRQTSIESNDCYSIMYENAECLATEGLTRIKKRSS